MFWAMRMLAQIRIHKWIQALGRLKSSPWHFSNTFKSAQVSTSALMSASSFEEGMGMWNSKLGLNVQLFVCFLVQISLYNLYLGPGLGLLKQKSLLSVTFLAPFLFCLWRGNSPRLHCGRHIGFIDVSWVLKLINIFQLQLLLRNVFGFNLKLIQYLEWSA